MTAEEMDDNEANGRPLDRTLTSILRPQATLFMISLAILVIYLIVALPYLTHGGSYQVGKPSPSSVTARKSFQIEDVRQTMAARDQERQRVKDLYIDPSAGAEAITRLRDFFVMVPAWELEGNDNAELRRKVQAVFGLELSEAQMASLTGATDEIMKLINSEAVEIIGSLEQDPISTENFEIKQEEAVLQASQLSLEQEYRDLTGVLAAGFLEVNTAYPLSLITREMEKAAQMISPAYIQVSEGELIIQKGDIVTSLDVRKLEESGSLSTMDSLQQMLGIFLLFAGIAAAFYFFLKSKRGKDARYIPRRVQFLIP